MNKEFIILSKEDLEKMNLDAARAGAQAAMERLEAEKEVLKQKTTDRKLHNTKLLLKNYRLLKENADSSVYGRSQMEESAADILDNMMDIYDDNMVVESIKKSATRTAIMITHIDKMLLLYKLYCERSSNVLDVRRYEVLYDRYINEESLSVFVIAKMHNMSKENVYFDLKIATESLSTLLFGVDGMTLQ